MYSIVSPNIVDILRFRFCIATCILLSSRGHGILTSRNGRYVLDALAIEADIYDEKIYQVKQFNLRSWHPETAISAFYGYTHIHTHIYVCIYPKMAGRATDRGACAFVANVTLATLRIYKFRPKISLAHLYMFEYPQFRLVFWCNPVG